MITPEQELKIRAKIKEVLATDQTNEQKEEAIAKAIVEETKEEKAQ